MERIVPTSRNDLRARVRDLVAKAEVGDRLPSERELSERWGSARMTIRRAVDALITEGLVERRHGSGTFVTPPPFVRILGLTSFSQDMRIRGMVPSSKLLSFRTITAESALAAQLRISTGNPVVTFTRLRLGSGDPMAVESVWIPAAFVPGLTSADLSGSLYEFLARRYRIVTGAATVSIAPITPEPRVSALLSIPRDQSCLRIQMVDSDLRNHVFMSADCVYRGDKYQLTAEISGAAFAATRAPRRTHVDRS